MDITRTNFEASLQSMQDAIASASVVAFDFELSGLHSSSASTPLVHDTLEERYAKYRTGVRYLYPLQIGLCCASLNESAGCWEARTFNVWLFHSGSSMTWFTVQSSSFAFLAANGFSFDRWVNEGVPWLSLEQQRSLARERNQSSSSSSAASPWRKSAPVATRDSDREWLAARMKEVDEWVRTLTPASSAAAATATATAASSPPPSSSSSSSSAAAAATPTSRELRVGVSNRFLRVLLAHTVLTKYPDSVHVKDGDGSDVVVLLPKADAIADGVVAQENRSRERQIFTDIGFGHVMQELVARAADRAAPLVLVGHNCLLDLFFLMHHFHARMPDTLGGFRSQLHNVFPLVVDTKYLYSYVHELTALQVPSHLEGLFASVTSLPAFAPDALTHVPIVQPEGFSRYRNDNTRAHEAGYDAFMTAVVYLRTMEYLRAHPPRAPLPSLALDGGRSTPNRRRSSSSASAASPKRSASPAPAAAATAAAASSPSKQPVSPSRGRRTRSPQRTASPSRRAAASPARRAVASPARSRLRMSASTTANNNTTTTTAAAAAAAAGDSATGASDASTTAGDTAAPARVCVAAYSLQAAPALDHVMLKYVGNRIVVGGSDVFLYVDPSQASKLQREPAAVRLAATRGSAAAAAQTFPLLSRENAIFAGVGAAAVALSWLMLRQ